jgi:hypothetical protein
MLEAAVDAIPIVGLVSSLGPEIQATRKKRYTSTTYCGVKTSRTSEPHIVAVLRDASGELWWISSNQQSNGKENEK